MEPEFITIREAVSICHASERKLRQAIDAGKIAFYLRRESTPRPGTGNRPVKHVRIDELERWLNEDMSNLVQRNGRVKAPA